MSNKLEGLLYNISEIKNRFLEINMLTGNRFNVFNVLKMETKEVKLHSAFIAELLNPLGIHDMGFVFLDKFILVLKEAENISSIKFTPSPKSVVKVEHHLGLKTEISGGRVDIIIKDENGHHLIIENKIYANDQENQLLRYNNIKSKEKCLLYLTLTGDEPQEESCAGLIKEIDFHCISYRETIIKWLEDCHKISISHPKLRETILQYINTIKQLTGLSMSNLEETKAIYNTVGHSESNALAGYELVKQWINIKWHTEWDFWNELHLSINNQIPNVVFEKEYDADSLNSAIHSKKNKNPHYGISALLCEVNYEEKLLQIYLTIQRGFGNLSFGINVFEKGKDDNENNYYNLRIKHNKNSFFKDFEANENRYWSYKKEAFTPINFNYFGDEETIKLINHTFRQQKINLLIDEIKEVLFEFENDEIIISSKT